MQCVIASDECYVRIDNFKSRGAKKVTSVQESTQQPASREIDINENEDQRC